MKSNLRSALCLACITVVVCGGLTERVEAGNHMDVWTLNEAGDYHIISFRHWAKADFPLEWLLHKGGIVGDPSAPITVTEAKYLIEAAFEKWEVGNSYIDVKYKGLTDNHDGKARADQKNIVTWVDDTLFNSPLTSAKAITTAYVGQKIWLDPEKPDGVEDGVKYWDVMTIGENFPEIQVEMKIWIVGKYKDEGLNLAPGQILDMDMVFNPDTSINWVTTMSDLEGCEDCIYMPSTATHEAGHMLGFAHASLRYDPEALEPVTMFPGNMYDADYQENRGTPAPDDEALARHLYPEGLVGGVSPNTPGAITGRVMTKDGEEVQGARVWAYATSNLIQPVYETFTLTEYDIRTMGYHEPNEAGEYLLDGLKPGYYFICITWWQNKVPEFFDGYYASPLHYNLTALNRSGPDPEGFSTEFYDDLVLDEDLPDFQMKDMFRRVEVKGGQTTPKIDFIIGAQPTDLVLVMDRSGSMNLSAASGSITKLRALKNAAHAFVDLLDLATEELPPPRLGLVQFEKQLVPMNPMFDLQVLSADPGNNTLEKAHEAIENMTAGGLTNIITGVDEAIDQLNTVADPRHRRIILLFSDGKHNWPWGSDLYSIRDEVVDEDITFYSVGFGTDVDGLKLSKIADDSGGLHVENQFLNEDLLTKHFLSIAASAGDQSAIIDPRYVVTPDRPASQDVEVTGDDSSLLFVVHWVNRDSDPVDVVVSTPGGCHLKTAGSAEGYEVRRGKTYRMVRIPLPFKCQGGEAHRGTWTITARHKGDSASKEAVNILSFGSSRTALFAENFMSRNGPVVAARLVRDGVVQTGVMIKGEAVLPVRSTGDSLKDDKDGSRFERRARAKRQTEKIVKFSLYDDGTHGDARPKDGVFSGLVPVKDKEPVVYRIRLMAEYPSRRGNIIKREQWTSFYFDGSQLFGGRKNDVRIRQDYY